MFECIPHLCIALLTGLCLMPSPESLVLLVSECRFAIWFVFSSLIVASHVLDCLCQRVLELNPTGAVGPCLYRTKSRTKAVVSFQTGTRKDCTKMKHLSIQKHSISYFSFFSFLIFVFTYQTAAICCNQEGRFPVIMTRGSCNCLLALAAILLLIKSCETSS